VRWRYRVPGRHARCSSPAVVLVQGFGATFMPQWRKADPYSDDAARRAIKRAVGLTANRQKLAAFRSRERVRKLGRADTATDSAPIS